MTNEINDGSENNGVSKIVEKSGDISESTAISDNRESGDIG